MQFVLLRLIGVYQRLSRYTPATCRFTPTCSEYARQAIVKFGGVKGSWLAIKRIARCHPWNPGGEDLVP